MKESEHTRMKLIAWTSQLDPKTHRSADITVTLVGAGSNGCPYRDGYFQFPEMCSAYLLTVPITFVELADNVKSFRRHD